MVNALLALLVCQLAGETAVGILHLPIPGPVLGLLLMLTALAMMKKVPESLDKVSGTLLANLSLLFVPAGVGIVAHLSRVTEEILPISVALIVSTVATLAVTAGVFILVDRTIRKPGKSGAGK